MKPQTDDSARAKFSLVGKLVFYSKAANRMKQTKNVDAGNLDGKKRNETNRNYYLACILENVREYVLHRSHSNQIWMLLGECLLIYRKIRMQMNCSRHFEAI